MQRSCHPGFVAYLLSGRPTVGDLMSLCEENYRFLQRLAPALRDSDGLLISHCSHGLDLYLEIEEQARYTTQVRLTYFFQVPESTALRPDPDARLRIYHDALQVEVLDLRQSVLPLRGGYQPPALADKWQANLFLMKWLTFCLCQGHCFQCQCVLLPPSDRVAPLPFCI
jgi:hypothetical protein